MVDKGISSLLLQNQEMIIEFTTYESSVFGVRIEGVRYESCTATTHAKLGCGICESNSDAVVTIDRLSQDIGQDTDEHAACNREV